MTDTEAATYDRAAIERDLMEDGITGLKGAFGVEWADRMREDIEAAFEEASAREGGTVGRGPNRYYVEIHPEQLRGFLDIVSHPWFQAVCETVVGAAYHVGELGFDIPFAGVDAPGAGHDAFHDLAMTRPDWEAIPERVRGHLLGRVVDRPEPIVQQHTIEGLVMGEP
jgi:hypothetical protein